MLAGPLALDVFFFRSARPVPGQACPVRPGHCLWSHRPPHVTGPGQRLPLPVRVRRLASAAVAGAACHARLSRRPAVTVAWLPVTPPATAAPPATKGARASPPGTRKRPLPAPADWNAARRRLASPPGRSGGESRVTAVQVADMALQQGHGHRPAAPDAGSGDGRGRRRRLRSSAGCSPLGRPATSSE